MKLKEFVKHNETLHLVYRRTKNLTGWVKTKLIPTRTSRKLYKKVLKKDVNLKNPESFNEKLMYLKLYHYPQNDLVIQCTDKYLVRKYIEECNCEEILNEIYEVYDKVEDINWNALPDKFALKCNHGCGYNIVCPDKTQLDEKETKKQLRIWLQEKFGYSTEELHYNKIQPRIICERYIETSQGVFPNDYKIFCFNGEPKYVLVCEDRGNNLKRDFLTTEWKKTGYRNKLKGFKDLPNKPTCYEQMLEYARKLSKPFKFVRVDLYDYNGKVLFGELTFSPEACIGEYSQEGEKVLGRLIEL